jgi:hypothetical protein
MGLKTLTSSEIESVKFVLAMARKHALDPDTVEFVNPDLIPQLHLEQHHLSIVEGLCAKACEEKSR